jgi:hypothetical protein
MRRLFGRAGIGLSAAGVLVAVLALGDAASAGARWRGAPEGGQVTAVSRHGNGSVSGPVRATSTGYEVRLPGGTWVACRRSCSETLRVETVDIFETGGSVTGYGTAMNECGIFGCLTLGYPR